MSYIFESLYLFASGLGGVFREKVTIIILFAALLLILLIFQILARIKFKNKQLEYQRVKDALIEINTLMKKNFMGRGVNYPPKRVFIRIFKEERILELWACSKGRGPFTYIKEYEISSISVSPGPKGQQGDNQIPEGFYYIDRFNPVSSYYLSLGLNYPNESDYILGTKESLGSDIYIHGGLSTDGCISVTDGKIKEIYIMAVEAVASGQDRIPVHIFPNRLNDKGYNELKSRYEDNYSLISFWDNIKTGFDKFEQTHMLPNVTVSTDGKYIFK